MGQHGRRRDSDESESSAQRGRTGLWLRSIAACALALTLGLGQAATDHAYADTIANAHEGGQGRDKGQSIASRGAFAGDGSANACPTASPEAFGGFQRAIAKQGLRARANAPSQVVTVNVEEDGVGTAAWSRTVTRTVTNLARVTSITRSFSYAADEEGNQAIAKAVARASAPNNVAAVRNGAGNIVAKTSVDVTGNGTASADAGGSIGVSRGGVKVSTWGETSAEVH
jgi:hypothetical protein